MQAVFNGKIRPSDVASAQQYALGRYQRSGQTVSGTAAGYSSRYFFDEVVEDYYKVPKRIKAVTKDLIISVSRSMFADHVWGLGALGSCGQTFIDDLHTQSSALWQNKHISNAKQPQDR